MRFECESGRFLEPDIDPDRLAVVGADRSLSWRAFRDEVTRFVAEARALGAVADCPIILLGHKQASFLVAMAGCLALGAPYVPVDVSVPPQRRRRIYDLAQPYLEYDCASGCLRRLGSAPVTLDEKGVAYIIFTSGSTGDPKGVQIGRECVSELSRWIGESFGLPAKPVFFNLAPINFDLTVFESFGMLALGATIVLNDAETQRNGSALVRRARETKAQVWVSTPSSAFQRFVDPDFCAEAMPDMAVFLFCGEVLPPAVPRFLRRRFPKARIINSYGPTEVTVINTQVEITDDVLADHAVLPVGRSKPRAWLEIDPANGEILAFGENVMRGYLNRPDLNAGKMLLRDGRRGFRTGDLGRLEPDGMLFCMGRLDDQIKLNGYRIELGEVDAALSRLTGIAQAATVVLRKPDGTAVRLVGCYVASGEALGDWRAGLSEILPTYMVPSELVEISLMPITSNGKVDRTALRERCQG